VLCSSGNPYIVHSTPLKGLTARVGFFATVCLTTYQSPIPEHQPEILLTGAQLVGFNNESFHRAFFISVPINVGIPTGTHYYINDRD
jgi:hypothetical protein